MRLLQSGLYQRELTDPTDAEIKEYLSGNLCRCTGYASHMRAIHKWLKQQKEAEV